MRRTHDNQSIAKPRAWQLQDAKARFSELVRKAQAEGPQRVTVHGREGVIVLSEDDYLRLTSTRSGADLVSLMTTSPLAGIELDHAKVKGPVRDVDL